MKKTLLAISLLGTFGVACAQSNVTVYGTLDAGISSSIGANSAGTVTSVQSGQESYSRLGFKGSEDLGDGMKAIFVLEQGILLNSGTSGLNGVGNNVPVDQNNGTFSSQAYVGLGGNFGTLTVGRQFTPLYQAYGSIDPFVNGFAANINNFFGTDANNSSNYQRMSNAAIYSTPDNLYGFKGSVAYGFGGVAGDTSAQSQVGASLGYANGPVTVAYAYHQANNEQNGVVGASTDTFKTNFIGAAYDFGVVKAHAAFDQNEQGDTFKTQDYLVGVTVPFGAHAVFADYTHKNNKLIDNADADQYAIGYTYNLSKRTNLYTAYTYVKNQENSTIDTEVAGNSVGTIQVGLRHSF
jgi:predicted porin